MTNIKIPRALTIATVVMGVIVLVIGGYTFGLSRRNTTDQTSQTNNNTAKTVNTNKAVSNGNSNSKVVNANANTNANSNTNAAVTTNTNSTNTATTITAITDAGVTWLNEPQLLDNLKLLADSDVVEDSDTYYKIADLTDGGEIIYLNRETMVTEVLRFRKTAAGTYYLLANHSNEYYTSDVSLLAAGVALDTTTTYAALDYPTELKVDGMTLEQHWLPFSSNELFSLENDNPAQPFVALGETPYGTIYLDTTDIETTVANGSIKSKSYVLKLVDNTVVRYWAKKYFLADDGSLIAEFEDDNANLADRTYFVGMISNGCGVLGGDQYLVDMTAEAMMVVATTTTNETLYTILDPESTALLNAYDTYKIGRDYEGSTEALLSYDEFVAATPVVVWQDQQGDYLLLMDNDFAPLAECGKPVIYLYPSATTAVSVRVGADVRISEPTYGTGWLVTAKPNGELTLPDGSNVNSLYWEGKGYGKYPQITVGRVVETKNIEPELRNDLAAQGLNAKEIADFLEFWLPRMPKTPYIRLSWLTTEQMNQLAPLAVQPSPDTVVRVFLDFAGRTTPTTNLHPQQLQTVERTGFTLVEWGGLLLGQ